MNIDLSVINFTGTVAASYAVRYARVDNTTTPVFITAGNPTAAQFPYNIPNVPNGQYTVGITPVYADGRACSETQNTTSPCPAIVAFNAVVNPDDSTTFKVTYSALGAVPQVYLIVNYPNGGSFTGIYTNGANGNTILVPVPSGLFGNYVFYMQSVCDPDTVFYSAQTPPVTVAVSAPVVTNNSLTIRVLNTVSYWNNKTDACTAIGAYGPGFELQVIYVKASDYANYLAGVSVDAYSDSGCTVLLTDTSKPANSTFERVLFNTNPNPNIWQTDSNNIVSITLQSC